MGTLLNQELRKWMDIDKQQILYTIQDIGKLCDDTGFTPDQVISLLHVLELRRKNNLYIANGDALDKQLADLGDLFKELIRTLGKEQPLFP